MCERVSNLFNFGSNVKSCRPSYFTSSPIGSSSSNPSLFALPTRLGGLSTIKPASLDKGYKNSLKVTQALISRIIQQRHELGDECEQQRSIKDSVKRLKEHDTKLASETLTLKLSMI